MVYGCHERPPSPLKEGEDARARPDWAGATMKQLFFAVFMCLFFGLVGYAAERAQVPPFSILGETVTPILFAVVGLVVGFCLGNR